MKALFNDGWKFYLEGEENPRLVDLPHDWLIKDTRNLYKTSVGVYTKSYCPAPDIFTQQKRVFLRFDGVYQDSTLYINGEKAGEWKNGYTAHSYDITPFLRENGGENEIKMRVDYQSPNSRWYSGAGIYRDCWLLVKNAAHFAEDGIYITPTREGDNWRVEVGAEVQTTEGIAVENTEIRHRIEGFDAVFSDSCTATNPLLWDIKHPHCYTLVSELYVNGELTDTALTRFGFREIKFTTEDGFYLNGRRVPLNGVCQHHDLGGLGSAVHKDALRRQLEILREMGVNAIRTAHNPPAAVFMELADEMGFLIQSEFTDMWKRSKTRYDYARFFEEWVIRDVAAWVRRDRNCPSLIMWSVGNEIYDTHADAEDGGATLQQLMGLVAQHDPNQHGVTTFCSNYMPWENTQKCAEIIKLMGYNYAEYLYHDHHAKHPDWIIYGGETASTVQSRGVYHFPLAKPLLSDDDLQCSALGNSTTSWGAKTTEACIIDHRDAPFTPGQFLWTGTDYIGEPTPYHTKNSYFGQADTAGFPKDSYYIYKSAWMPFDAETPVLHLFPHWDWNPGQPVDVRIVSNAPTVELFVNGKSMGTKDIDHEKGKKLTADYIVPYVPGEIKAVAYDHAGHVIKEVTRRSFGDAVKLQCVDKMYGELIFTEITALDGDNNPVENANNRVQVTVENGTLLALDNGDSTDFEQYQPETPKNHSRRLFSGKLLAITKLNKQAQHKSGNITLVDYGAQPIITATLDPGDIPVRKIEITQHENYTFTAKIHPPNATYTHLHWRLTDAGGIDSPLGKTETTTGSTFSFTPKGDGEIFVRCATHNGKNHPDIISLLPVTLTGFGKPFLDPYAFLSGGLYNTSNVPMTNGNDRGVATLRDGESHVGFADIDFGPYGSSEITLWLFPLEGSPFDFDIYLGMPGDTNARLLCTAHYDKGSRWNTYIPVTYTLPEKLTLIQTLCFVFNRKVHIKGFQFAAAQRAFTQIPFPNHDHIYGDSYTLTPEAIEKVGNNVNITFNDMDFTNKTANQIQINYRANRDNTIRLVFTTDENETGGEVINLLTLPARADYSPTLLNLETPLTKKGTLRFLFLPGTEIDLQWFNFG